MKSPKHPKSLTLVNQGIAAGVLIFIMVGVFHVIPADFSNHTKIEPHWSSASPVLQIPFEEKDKEDNEDDLDDASTNALASVEFSIRLTRSSNCQSKYTAGPFHKIPVFLYSRSIRI